MGRKPRRIVGLFGMLALAMSGVGCESCSKCCGSCWGGSSSCPPPAVAKSASPSGSTAGTAYAGRGAAGYAGGTAPNSAVTNPTAAGQNPPVMATSQSNAAYATRTTTPMPATVGASNYGSPTQMLGGQPAAGSPGLAAPSGMSAPPPATLGGVVPAGSPPVELPAPTPPSMPTSSRPMPAGPAEAAPIAVSGGNLMPPAPAAPPSLPGLPEAPRQ